MKAIFSKNNNKEIIIKSEGREARVLNFGEYWNLTYASNGNGKNFQSYASLVEHLKNRGW